MNQRTAFAMGEGLQEIMDYGVDRFGRRVFLQTNIDEGSMAAASVIRGLLYLEALGREPIDLWINCDGGSVEEALAIHDVIRSMAAPVRTIGHGLIASAGVLLLACGTGARLVTPNAWLMHHESEVGMGPDTTRKQLAKVQHSVRLDTQWADLLGLYTQRRLPPDFWLHTYRGEPELWLDAPAMIEYGLADHILR